MQWFYVEKQLTTENNDNFHIFIFHFCSFISFNHFKNPKTSHLTSLRANIASKLASSQNPMFLLFPLLKLFFLSLAFISPPYDPVHPVETRCVGNGNLKCFVLVLSEIGGENPLRKSPISKALFTFHHFPCTFSLEISMDKIFGTNMKLRMFCPPKNLYPFHGMVLISF